MEVQVAKILVVDDDGITRELIALHLAIAGYAVATAEDGMAGEQAVRTERPALIISDVNMPNKDGFEFVLGLRQDVDTAVQEIPVIFLTSVADGRLKGMRLGAVAYLTKPLVAENLLSLVAENVGRRSLNRSNLPGTT